MKLGSFGLASLILFAVAATASGQATLVQAFVSDGSVDIEADLDNTDVTIYYSATLNTLNEVQTLSLSGGESKTIALPDGYYALESNNPVRVLGQPLPEEPTLVVAPTPAIAQTTIQEDPVPPQVHVAPWRGTLPHEIYNGKRARLKAVATQGTAALSQYKWDLTDGYSTGWLAYPGRNLQLDHTFPDGADNKPWGATITVKDSTGFTATDVYNIVVRPGNLDTKRHIAIDDGLWWLHKVPTLGGSGETATAYWRPRDGYYMAATGIAVTAFENSGFLPSGDADNPYTDTVQRGLNYLMGTLRRYNFGETDKWFDMGANGYGLCSNTARTFYEGGIVLLAISGAQEPDKIVPAGLGIAEVRGHTYKQVAQEMSDYFGGGQYDSGNGAGGWRYSYNQWPDMSAVQWPVLGMHAAEENLGIDVHSSVKTRLRDHWLGYDQNANGGFGYTHPGETVNVTKTGAGLACFWWVGKDQTDAKVQNAVNYITNNWGTGNVGMFYPMYAVMKGARLASPEIATFGSHNWYTEYCNWLVGSQHNDGYWNDNDTWISPYLGTQMRTAMGVLIMTTAVITQPPVASFTIEPNPADVDIEITFDASASFDPNERPLTYSWDFGDSTTGAGVVATHTYTTQETFTVVLTVANNQIPPQQGIATQQVYITPPNHPPTSIPGGPYSGWIGPSTFPLVTLDGSASYDINAPVDHLTKYEWELDNIFPYDFDEGNTPITQYSFTTAGTKDVALRVTDDPNAGFVNSGLSHTVWTTVEITLDDIPPTNTLTIDPAAPGGANDWYLTQPTATITATDGDSGMKAIRYWWDDGAPTDVPGDTAVVPASEGDHVLHYGGVDNVDNFNEETVQIKLDTSTPTTAIHFSTGDGPYGADWYHSAVGLTVHANGGTSGIASAEYSLDAGPWTLYGDSEVVDVLTDGPHTLETKVVTNSGKQTGTSVAFNIDTTQPVTVLTTDPAAPDGNNGWFVTIPNVTLNASDPGGEAIAEIRYRWEGDAGETVAAGNTATFPGSPPVATLHFYAVNENGNPEVEQTAQIKIDLAAPTAEATADPPADGSNGWHLTQPTVNVAAADLFGIAIILDGQTSGVALIRYHWDADDPTEVAGSAVALPAAPGEHTLHYEAEDNAGNVSDEQTVDTKYDDSTVSVGIALAGTDLGGGLYAGAVQATLTADGGMSGIDTTEYQINGGASTPFTSPEAVAVTTWGSNQVDAQVVSVSGQTANAQATFDIDAGPTIVSQDPDGHTNQPVSSVTLQTSEPVVGADARDTSNYSLQHLGSDRAPGGGDDSTVVVSPSYIDGTTQIELLAVGDNTVNLSAWGEMDYATGGSGDWRIEGGGYSVKQYINGAPTFYVSDFDLIDRQFRGKIKVEEGGGDDDFVGFAFGFQTSAGKPNNFYLLSWKQGNQNSAYEGFKLVKITNSAPGDVDFWILPAGPKVQVLATKFSTSDGWLDNVEYEFSFRYQSNGNIDISIRRTSNGAVMWETSVNDPTPLGVGKVAFYNYSQQWVRYSGLQQADFLEEGAYQITAASGNPGLRDVNGTPLDGNADGIAPEDYVGTFVIDQTPPDVTGITIASSAIEVAYHDLGGIDEATVTDVANYTLLASGGDGSFDDGNEPDLTGRITGITYVAGDGGDGVATLAIAPPLEDELYRLTINGTTSIQDLAGNKLLGGDHQEALSLETGPATVALDLDATTDSGVSSDDDLTNQTELLFNVTVNKAGRIGIDFDGDAAEDANALVSAAGTYQFTSPALADGLRNAGATLDPPVGAQATGALPVTIDTAGPLGVAGAATELGPLAERQVAFDEDIDPATFDASDVVFTGPGDVDLGAVSGVSGTGAAFTITFPNQTAAGAYSLLIGPDVRDLAGNMLNQNDNDINGEIGADEFDDTFDLVPDTFGPAVTGHEPTGLVGPGITGVRLTFDEWMAAGSFTGDDVAMATPAGNVDSSLIAIAPVVDPGNPGLFNTFDVQFPAQTADGPYTLTMGPGITDLTGNPLNQDGDVNNGEPEDVYDATFSVDGLPPITTLATAPPAPDGLDDWFIAQPQVTLTATDAGVGVKEIRYWWNDGAPIVASGASASFPAPGGANTLQYFAVDLYDQAEAEQTAEIKYDDSTPTVSIQLAGAGGPNWFTDDVTATVTPNGDGVAITSTEIKTDGGGWTDYTAPVVVSGEGAHTVNAQIETETGKTAQASATFTIDISPPATSLATIPAAPNGNDGWFVTQPNVRLTATDAGVGVKEIHYWWNTDAETVAPGGFVAFNAPGGINTLHYFAVDQLDNAGPEQTAEIKYDDSTPSVSIQLAGPVGGAGWYTGSVDATVTSDGDGRAVTVTEIKADGGPWAAYAAPVTVSGEGAHTVQARIETETGKPAQTSETFTIDVNPPVTTQTTSPAAPDGTGGWFITQPQVILNASDAGSSVAEIHYWWNADAETVVAGSSASFPAPAGVNTVHFFAVDSYGHAETEQTAEIKYDGSSPSVAIQLAGTLGGPGWYESDVVATVVPNGDGLDVISTEIKVDSGPWTAYLAAATVTGDGQHTVRARIETTNGKTAQSTETFNIDGGGPTTILATLPPAPDGLDNWFLTQPQVQLTAGDPGSGVQEIRYWWNGEPETVVAGSSASFAGPGGINTLHYYAVDTNGHAEAEHTAEIKYDDTAPSVSIALAGPGGPDWFTGDVDVSVASDGDGVPVAATEIRTDGGGWTAYATPVTVSGEGTHSAVARITTARGRTAAASDTFVIDLNPPITTMTTSPRWPDGNDGWFVTQPTVHLAATDAGVGVKEIRYWWNAEAQVVVSGATASFAAPGGINTLHYQAVDLYGQVEAEQTVEIKYDDTPMSVDIAFAGTGGPDWYDGDVEATVSATGPPETVIQIRVDDEVLWQVYAGPETITGDGRHSVIARASIASGRTATTTGYFGIDTLPPVSRLTVNPSVPDGYGPEWYASAPTITIAADDAGAGVNGIDYVWDDTDIVHVAGSTARPTLAQGEHVLHYWAIDNLGRTEAEQQATFRLDSMPPTIADPSQAPATPGVSDDVDISVEITDSMGVETASLWYTHGSIWQRMPMAQQAATDVYQATIPATATPKVVRYMINATDANGNQAESNGYWYYTGSVNLTVDSLNYTGDLGDGGASKVVASIGNTGATDMASPTKAELYVDGRKTASVGIAYVASGDSIDVELPWTRTGGDHQIRVVVDPDDDVPETNENDNELTDTVSVVRCNLIAENLQVPGSLAAGDRVTFTADVRAEVGTVQSFSATIYINGSAIGGKTINGLATGQTTGVSASWLVTGGSHTVMMKADSRNGIGESNEGDNTVSQALPVVPQPDFVADSLTPSTTDPMPGEAVGLEAVVRNTGAAYTGGVAVQFYADNSSFATLNLNGMASGEVRTLTVSWTASPGHHVLRATIDPSNHVGESNEGNNSATATSDVPGLTLSPPTAHVWSGQATPLTYTLRNSGGVALNVTAAGSPAAWLTLNSGVPVVLAPGQSAPLVFHCAGLSAGSHNTVINVTAVTPASDVLNLSTPVSVTATELTTSYTVGLAATTNVSRGQQVNATLAVQNTSNQAGTFDLALSGAAAGWAQLPTTQISLGIGQQTSVTIPVSVPTDPGTPASAGLQADVSRTGTGQTLSASVTFNVSEGPIISALSPADGTTLGSNTVAFQWQTNVSSSTSIFYREQPTGGAPVVEAWTETTGVPGTSHQCVSAPLAREQWYDFYAESSTPHGTTATAIRSIYIGRGVVFVQNVFNFNIDRDYDQRRSIAVRNNDNNPHQVLVGVANVPPELIVGFVGSGSMDQMLTLNPGQTANVTLAIHGQDLPAPNISFTATLSNFGLAGEDENITDSALVNLNVHFQNFNFSVQEVGSAPSTLAKTFEVHNLGDTITDLNINPGGGLAGMTLFDPEIHHGYLGAGQNRRFTVTPSLYVGFETLAGTISVRGGNKTVTLPVTFSVPNGMGVYVGVIGGIPQVPALPIGADVVVNDPSAGQIVIRVGDGTSDPCETTIYVSSFPVGGPAPPQVTQYTNGLGQPCAILIIVTPRPAGGWLQWTIEMINICDMAYQLPGINVLISELLYMAEWQFLNGFINNAQRNWFNWIAQNVWPFWELIRPNLDPNGGGVVDPGEPGTGGPGPGDGNGNTTQPSDEGAEDMADEAANNNGNDSPPAPGSDSYNGGGATMNRSARNWYCTNRPSIGNRVGIPSNARRGRRDDDWLKDFMGQEADRRRKIARVCLFASAFGMFASHRDPTNPLSIPGAPGPDYIAATRGSIDIARSAGQYQRMANDPPSPVYTLLGVPRIPDPAPPIAPITPVYEQIYRVSASAVSEEKLVQAMVSAIESRDGADSDGSELWYMRQGRTLRRLTDLLRDQQRTTANELAKLGELMRAEFPAGLTKADALAIQQHVANDGFTPTELERLLEIITPEVVEDFRQWFAGLDFSDLPDDLIATVEESSGATSEFAAQLSDHQVYNPDTQNVLRTYLTAGFSLPWPTSTYNPHDVDVLVNGNLAAKLTDAIPEGTYMWEADPSFFNYVDRGVADNSINFNTTHLNGGHYVVNEEVTIILQLSQIAIPVVAPNQEAANASVHGLEGITSGAPDVAMYVGDMRLLGPANTRDPVDVRITVRNIGTVYVGATTITLYEGNPAAGGSSIGQVTTAMEPFELRTLDVQWRPSVPGDVTLYAVADPVAGESDTTNNQTTLDVTVTEVVIGDLNADRWVNILDMILIRNFMHTDAALHPEADLNGDGAINVLDMIRLRLELGN